MFVTSSSLVSVQDRIPYKLPIQVLNHFDGLSDAEVLLLSRVYSGKNPNPSFEEWLEAYQHNMFFEKSLKLSERDKNIRTAYHKQQKLIEKLRGDSSTDSNHLKTELKELKRLSSLLSHNEDAWMNTNRELNKIVQETLKREKPKELNIRHTMSVEDINNILQSEKEFIDAEWSEVED